MKKNIVLLIAVLYMFATSHTTLASEVQSNTHQVYTITGFINMLVENGFISKDSEEKAYDVVNIYLEKKQEILDKGNAVNADKTEITTSQFIQHASLTYNRFEDISGLLLKVENITDEPIRLEAKRQCQVVYRIYTDKDDLVYDSSTETKCQTDELVTYSLGAKRSRIFEITHRRSTRDLPKGEYRVEIEYPGYGKGERTITIL